MPRSRTSPLFKLVTALAVVALGLSSRDASAFCRTTTCDTTQGDVCEKSDDGCVHVGVPLRWAKLPIVYRFSAAGSSKLDNTLARAIIRRSFAAWTEVQCEHGHT